MFILSSSFQSMRHAAGSRIAQHGRKLLAGKKSPQSGLRMAREKLPQIFSAMARLHVMAQQPLNGLRHFIGGAAIAHRPRESGMLAHRASQAEVISVLGAAFRLDLFAF